MIGSPRQQTIALGLTGSQQTEPLPVPLSGSVAVTVLPGRHPAWLAPLRELSSTAAGIWCRA